MSLAYVILSVAKNLLRLWGVVLETLRPHLVTPGLCVDQWTWPYFRDRLLRYYRASQTQEGPFPAYDSTHPTGTDVLLPCSCAGSRGRFREARPCTTD